MHVEKHLLDVILGSAAFNMACRSQGKCFEGQGAKVCWLRALNLTPKPKSRGIMLLLAVGFGV